MNETIFYTLLGTLSGAIGTGLGGVFAICTNKKSNKFLSCILELSAGLMLSVVFLDLLPNAFLRTDFITNILGLLIGIFFMVLTKSVICDDNNSYQSIGMVLAVGIALHNLPEGLAIGVSLDADFSLGLSIALAILLHDVPEGLAMSIPLKMANMHPIKILCISIFAGLTTGLGGLIGVIIGKISDNIIGLSLSIASGAMIYVIIMELIPKSKEIYKGKLSSEFNMLGIILGVLVKTVLSG
ncbi:MAG: ZIP family metal transporter [Clostridia bacterium]